MGFPQARMTDLHICGPGMVPAPTPILPPCAMTVLVGGLPAARVTDLVIGTPIAPVPVPVPHPIMMGSSTVLITCLPAARIMDNCALGGMIILGCFTVLTG